MRQLAWLCTECATELFGYPFEETSIGGGGNRHCAKCGVVRERLDRMHQVWVADELLATFKPRQYPIERCVTMLRRRVDGLYEQRKETWQQLGEMRNFKTPRRLLRSELTGRVFGITRTVTPEAVEDGLEETAKAPDEVIEWANPEDWTVTYLMQIEGDAEDLTCAGLSDPYDPAWVNGVDI